MCLLTYYCYLQPKKIAVYELLEIPDDQLTADQLFTKKKQRMLKNAREGRARTQALQREKRQKVQYSISSLSMVSVE
jgi:hypothetical protein